MSSDSFLVEISLPLREAIGLAPERAMVDYFTLLGVERGSFTPNEVDRAVMSRSKEFRRWQNSPEHGDEAVKLLPMLHRIAAIIKDGNRCRAYEEELERLLRGDRIDPREEFTEMARAALADGSIDERSKVELLRFADQNRIARDEIGRIIKEVSATAVARPAAKTEEDEKWEMRVAEEGTEPFQATVSAMLFRGELNAETAATTAAEAGRLGVEPAEATTIIRRMVTHHFARLVRHVARNGVINNNQARLLMPKAKLLGLDDDAAFEIISRYTITGASAEELSSMTLTSASFEDSEIQELLARQDTVHVVDRWQVFKMYVPDWAGWAVLGLLVAAVLAYAAIEFLPDLISSPRVSTPSFQQSAPTTTPRASPSSPPTPSAQPVESVARPASSTPVAAAPRFAWETRAEDPADGLLLIGPEGDLAAFHVKITEVTCREYRAFLRAKLDPELQPADWDNRFNFPAGSSNLPVTNVTWSQAEQYCRWIAERDGLEPANVHLMTTAQFERLLRARLTGNRPVRPPPFWSTQGYAAPRKSAVITKKTDALFFEGQGQVYDLLANVAEWGMDELGEAVLLGGDYAQGGRAYDPRSPRSADPTTPLPTVGFRYVIEQ